MDEAKEKEERYYRYLEKKSFAMFIIAGALFTFPLLMMWDPESYWDLWMAGIYIAFSLLMLGVILDNTIWKKHKYGFWMCRNKELKTEERNLDLVIILIAFVVVIFFWLLLSSGSCEFIWVSILQFGLIPVVYFFMKRGFRIAKRKYGKTRQIYLNTKVHIRKKIISDTLDRMKIRYTEQDESSRLRGPKKCFALPDYGMKIFYRAYGFPPDTIAITNIPDNDSIEREIEKEILRLIEGGKL